MCCNSLSLSPSSFSFSSLTTRPQAPHPDFTKLPDSEIIGVTVVLITCSYQGAEFVRIGYYVNNDYADPALCGTAPIPIPIPSYPHPIGSPIASPFHVVLLRRSFCRNGRPNHTMC